MNDKKLYDLFLKYVNELVKIKNNHSYSPMKNKKYAVIMACHCDSTTKLEVIKNNLQYFDYLNIDVIIVNTSKIGLKNELIKTCYKYLNVSYYEIPNSSYYDFGKWIYALQSVVKIDKYDYIVLTNDSFIIHSSINHFFNLTALHDVELYGYNDSTQTRYHYQSYLFSLRKDAVKIFIYNVMNTKINITSQHDVIMNFEVKMTDWFTSKKCFLVIGYFKLNQFKNIFFINDLLYIPLKSSNLLPFTKLKRILEYNNNNDEVKAEATEVKSILEMEYEFYNKIKKSNRIENKNKNPNVKNMKYVNSNSNTSIKYQNENNRPFMVNKLMLIHPRTTSKKLI